MTYKVFIELLNGTVCDMKEARDNLDDAILMAQYWLSSFKANPTAYMCYVTDSDGVVQFVAMHHKRSMDAGVTAPTRIDIASAIDVDRLLEGIIEEVY